MNMFEIRILNAPRGSSLPPDPTRRGAPDGPDETGSFAADGSFLSGHHGGTGS